MKIQKLLIIIVLNLMTIFNLQAQKKIKELFSVTFDCAKPDNSISLIDLKNCATLNILGDEDEIYRVLSCEISLQSGSSLKTVTLMGGIFSDDFIQLISGLNPGSKINIDNAFIRNIETKQSKKLSKTILVVK